MPSKNHYFGTDILNQGSDSKTILEFKMLM